MTAACAFVVDVNISSAGANVELESCSSLLAVIDSVDASLHADSTTEQTVKN